HAAPSDFLEHAEPARHEFAGLERPVQQLQGLDHALGQEAIHAFLPQDPLLYLGVEIGVVAAGRAQIALPSFRRLLQRRENKLHYDFVAFALISHEDAFSLSNNQRLASAKWRCMVRSGRPSASAVSSFVKPMKYF